MWQSYLFTYEKPSCFLIFPFIFLLCHVLAFVAFYFAVEMMLNF